MSSLIGEIRERKSSATTTTPTPPPQGRFDPTTGFPAAQHRSKSAFARGRDAARNREKQPKLNTPPVVQQTNSNVELLNSPTLSSSPALPNGATDDDRWRRGMAEENDARIRAMSDAERERETSEIAETYGLGLLDLVRKAKRRRIESSSAKTPDSSRPVENESPLAGHETADSVTASHDEARALDLKLHTSGLHAPFHGSRPTSPLPSALRSSTPTKPASRKIHFSAEPAAVHVYESAPSSPKRRPIPLLLGAPDPDNPSENQLSYNAKAFLRNGDQLTTGENSMDNGGQPEGDNQVEKGGQQENGEQEDEGTPEYIRKRYFPSAIANDPSLEWMKAGSSKIPTAHTPNGSGEPSSSASPRYDLSGHPIPTHLRSSLPTHLGLHHHGGDQDQAGYSLEDLLLLSRSTVPAQRANMLGVLGKVLLTARTNAGDEEGEDELRTKVLAAALDAMMEKGSVGLRAVEVLWAAVVEYSTLGRKADAAAAATEDDALDITTLIPIPILLTRISTLLHPSTRALPGESLTQLVDVLLHLASGVLHGREVASEILQTPGLVQGVMATFLVPVSGAEASSASSSSELLNPQAVVLLDTIAKGSRVNAKRIVDDGLADTCLRFVVLPSDEEAATATVTNDNATKLSGRHTSTDRTSRALLIETLRLFATLGKFGMYANVAAEAIHALQLGQRVLKAPSDVAGQDVDLSTVYLELLEIWITCAVDPHRTTPSHDILWSQVVGWRWAQDVLDFRRNSLRQKAKADVVERVLTATWNVLSAWLEGCAINAVRAGEAERGEVVRELEDEEAAWVEETVLRRAVQVSADILRKDTFHESRETLVSLSGQARLVHAAMRLAQACVGEVQAGSFAPKVHFSSSLGDGSVLGASFAESTSLKALSKTTSPSIHALLRPITSLLVSTVTLHRVSFEATPSTQWLSLAMRSVACLLPGDEEQARSLFLLITRSITGYFVHKEWGWVDVPLDMWDKGALGVVLPFLFAATQRKDHLEGGAEGEAAPAETMTPYVTTPRSIQEVTTQILPAPQDPTAARSISTPGLPLANDWCLAPLNDLLHSGTAPVFSSLPQGWDHTEIDIVRGTLLLTAIAQEATRASGVCLMSREEIVFGCMKVFMLEHGQSSTSSAGSDPGSEVFRDEMVMTYMDKLLQPFVVGKSPTATSSEYSSSAVPPSLEVIARPFLGVSTPFYQFYSDLLGLYDSLSLGQPTFGSLLIPPLANATYAVDYRKLLWGDYPHVLRMLWFEPAWIIGDDARRWLWPIETDRELVSMYMNALGRNQPKGFLRWVAVHHVACNLWPDLRSRTNAAGSTGVGDEADESRRRKLLGSVLEFAAPENVKAVVLYRQPHPDDGPAVPPPECFRAPGNWKVERLKWVVSWASEGVRGRLEGLLSEERS